MVNNIWKNNKYMYILWIIIVILTIYSGIYLNNKIWFVVGAVISSIIVAIKGPICTWT